MCIASMQLRDGLKQVLTIFFMGATLTVNRRATSAVKYQKLHPVINSMSFLSICHPWCAMQYKRGYHSLSFTNQICY